MLFTQSTYYWACGRHFICMLMDSCVNLFFIRECSGSLVECLTQDRGTAGWSLTSVTPLCPWARHINPSLVLVQPRKTHPCLTERLLMGRKESNQTNKQKLVQDLKSTSMWYTGSGVVLDCIDSWTLPSFLLCPIYVLERCKYFFFHFLNWY